MFKFLYGFSMLILVFTTPLKAQVNSRELLTGDVLLQPLNCRSCRLIEEQEDSEYSHIGIVIINNGQVMVAEAYGQVRMVTLAEFLKKTHPEKSVKVRRLDHHFLNFYKFEKEIKNSVNKFIGNPYDRSFLWENVINGKEAIYCSELVYKVIYPQVKLWDLSPKTMLFDQNPELWDRYFRGETPRGKLGISPEDFNQSRDFRTLWTIN